jgi:hypothetical protein
VATWTEVTVPETARGDWVQPDKQRDFEIKQLDNNEIADFDEEFGVDIASMVDNRTSWTKVNPT